MFFLNLFRRLIPKLLLGNIIFFASIALGFAEAAHVVEHHDPIESDATLSLSKVIDLTLEKYPDTAWLKSLEEEAAAMGQRGDSWTAGASQAGLRFQEATSGTLHYIDGTVQVPLWNLGQRDAEQRAAKLAENSAVSQAEAVKLRVAGLIRAALWNMALANLSYEQAKAELTLTDQLLAKVQRRVELGDLPRADLLLAQSESLQKRSAATLAEAELMHARKRYTSITQMTKIPGTYQEKLVELTAIQQNHPALAAINGQIERKQAELNAVKLVGSGQTNVAVGINSDRFTNDPRSNQTESFNIGVTVPFGGSAHLARQVAAVNVELNRLIAEREQLSRDLEQAHHEAEHNLEVNRAELGIANELQQVAEEHLKMTQLSFSVGEIDLMDLLKIQSRTQQAVLNAKQRAIMLQRDIALYNQAIGVMP
ncbi:outer membrane efflux protein [Methylobacter tundripaludum]|uniref:Outer membrane efflux protein n=1 Tax=Methylobacter tundripaludum TaxID=173365 RepID=A0A2S6HLC7_9GAMM|nr:TolC family protein [Methylobacter tundripaludum]PPK78217.1 outer membrane efflux protein [Methylobacter tundripaludum]